MDVSSLAKTGSVVPIRTAFREVSAASKPIVQGVATPNVPQVAVDSTGRRSAYSPPDVAELHSLVDKANAALPANASNLKFSVAEGTDINVVRIEDTETGELIRQIPSETMIAIARAMKEAQHGMMLEEKA